jgi:phosphatidylglycerol---prolipoprotein diacylglyceryl transferase
MDQILGVCVVGSAAHLRESAGEEMINLYMDPILFHWQFITLGWHGIFLTAGILSAYQMVVIEGRRTGISSRYLSELIVWACILGYIGARLLYVLDHWEVFARDPGMILAVYKGGLALYGGLIGGTLATILFTRVKKLSFWHLADAITLGIPVGEMIGRFGCAINGDVYGIPTDGSWGLVYWHPNTEIPAQLLGVALVPSAVLLQIWNAGLLVLLLYLRKRPHAPGTLFLVGIMVYSLGRYLVNIWQAGEPFLFGLRQVQAVALLVIALSALLLLLRTHLRKPRVAGKI